MEMKEVTVMFAADGRGGIGTVSFSHIEDEIHLLGKWDEESILIPDADNIEIFLSVHGDDGYGANARVFVDGNLVLEGCNEDDSVVIP